MAQSNQLAISSGSTVTFLIFFFPPLCVNTVHFKQLSKGSNPSSKSKPSFNFITLLKKYQVVHWSSSDAGNSPAHCSIERGFNQLLCKDNLSNILAKCGGGVGWGGKRMVHHLNEH